MRKFDQLLESLNHPPRLAELLKKERKLGLAIKNDPEVHAQVNRQALEEIRAAVAKELRRASNKVLFLRQRIKIQNSWYEVYYLSENGCLCINLDSGHSAQLSIGMLRNAEYA